MTYYSERHYERVNGFKKDYLKEEINMERTKKMHKEHSIWVMIAIFGGLLLIGLLLHWGYHYTHMTLCHDTYTMGETGYYCQ